MLTSREKAHAAAQKFQQKGQLDKAIAELTRLVAEDPADVRTLLKIGDLHVRHQDTAAAIATYTQVAHAYRDQGFALKAVAVYKQVVHLAPQNEAAVGELAALYEQLSLVSDAAAQYRHLLLVHKTQGAWPQAATLVRKLMGLEGETQDLLLQWAEVHTELKDVPEVKRTLTRVADACLAQNRLDDWAQVAEDLLQVDPDLGGLACELAKHYMAKEQPKQALLKLQVAFKAAPQDTETLTLLAQVFEALGQAQKAVAVLQELGAQAQQRGQALALERVATYMLKLDPENHQAQAWMAPPGVAKATSSRQQARPPPPPPAGTQTPPQAGLEKVDLTNLLIEAKVFARYGLVARAQEYLARVLALFPDHREAIDLQQQLAAQTETSAALSNPPASALGAEPAPVSAGQDVTETFRFDGHPPAHVVPNGPKTDASAQDAVPGDEDDIPVLLDFDEGSIEQAFSRSSLDELIAEEVPDASNAPRGATRLDKHFDDILMDARGGAPIAPLTQVVEASDFTTQYDLGIAYKEMGLFDDALKQFERLIEVPTYRVTARSMMALCLEQSGHRDRAQQVIAAALEVPDASPHERAALHYDMALSLLESGDEDAARGHFEAAAQQEPGFRDAAARLSDVHMGRQL